MTPADQMSDAGTTRELSTSGAMNLRARSRVLTCSACVHHCAQPHASTHRVSTPHSQRCSACRAHRGISGCKQMPSDMAQ